MKRTLLLCCLVGSALLAQDKKKEPQKASPKVLYSVPLTVSASTTTKVLLRGLQLDSAMELTALGAKVVLRSKAKKPGPNNYPINKCGDSEAEIELELPKNQRISKVELLSGGTVLYSIPVDREAPTAEQEPNDTFKTAQLLTFPAVVTAKIDRERDVDVYRFTGKAGQVIQAEILAARLGAPTDTLLTLFDANRRTLAIVDDVRGQPDPELTFKLPADDIYFLSVIDAHDVGGVMFPYHLVLK